jgi:hypothetical protein
MKNLTTQLLLIATVLTGCFQLSENNTKKSESTSPTSISPEGTAIPTGKNERNNKSILITAPYKAMKKECLNNKKFLAVDYNIQCESNYHHYNSSAARNNYSASNAKRKGKVKIAEFNALHPGMSKTRFKDYKKVAQIINKYDIMGVTELIPVMADDAKNNTAVLNFIDNAPDLIATTKRKINSLQNKIRSSKRKSLTRNMNLKLYKLKLEQLQQDLINVGKIYRFPGYLKVLKELHKLSNGSEWALVLAPRAEGAESSPTPELVGYYYRTSIAKLDNNPYCSDIQSKMRRQRNPNAGKAAPAACIINMDRDDFSEDKRHVFSRRPFLAQFRSGNFKFTLITSHIIFDSPKDSYVSERMLQSAFDVSTYENLGKGLTKKNFARFSELKVTLDFIQQKLVNELRQKDIIYMGDFNILESNPFWDTVLKSWDDSKVFITAKTSVTKKRFNSGTGKETKGRSKNYDHFLFNPYETTECVKSSGKINGGVFDFMAGSMGRKIKSERLVRRENRNNNGTYPKETSTFNLNKKKHVTSYLNLQKKILTVSSRKYIYSGKKKISTTGIVTSETETIKHGTKYLERIMNSQLNDRTYYGFFQETISDHFPIYMECSNT